MPHQRTRPRTIAKCEENQLLDIRRLTRDGLFRHGNLTYSQANQPDLLARSMHESWRVKPKRLIRRRIRLLRLNLPVVGGDTRHG